MDTNENNAENGRLKTEIKLLHEKVKCLLNKIFGRSYEKLDPDQMELSFEELREMQDAIGEAEEKLEELESTPSRRGKRKPLKERIPEDLPTQRVVSWTK